MKRYDERGSKFTNGSMMEESEDGEWVKYEDADREKALAIAQAIISINKESTYLDSVVLNSESVECNCKEASREAKLCQRDDNGWPIPNSLVLNWICPAHGYKKI